MSSKTCLKAMILLILILLYLPSLATHILKVCTQEERKFVITSVKPLKESYRQDEDLIILAVIRNNRSTATLKLKEFNVTIMRYEAGGRRQTLFFTITIDLDDYAIEGNASYTVFIRIPLRNFPPGKYNVTAFFRVYYRPELYFEVYAIKGHDIRVLPSLEIPPSALLVIGIMMSIIIIYIGYGITGRFKK